MGLHAARVCVCVCVCFYTTGSQPDLGGPGHMGQRKSSGPRKTPRGTCRGRLSLPLQLRPAPGLLAPLCLCHSMGTASTACTPVGLTPSSQSGGRETYSCCARVRSGCSQDQPLPSNRSGSLCLDTAGGFILPFTQVCVEGSQGSNEAVV